MQTELAYLNESGQINGPIETKISFGPFITYLKEHIKRQKTIKAKFYEVVLQKFHDELAYISNISKQDSDKYYIIFEFIYSILSPLTINEEDSLWALSGPVSENAFYGTDAYFELVNNWNRIEPETELLDGQLVQAGKVNTNFIYNLILSKYYDVTPNIGERIIYSCPDPKTRLKKYYRLVRDGRFIEILSKKTIPVINIEMFDIWEQDGSVNNVLMNLLPLSDFNLEGFTILRLEDVTAEYAVDLIKKSLLEHASDQEILYDRIKFALTILGGDKEAQFGMLPFLSVNNKLVFDDVKCARSILIRAARKSGTGMADVYETAENFIKDPVIKVYPLITEELMQANPYLISLRAMGVVAYAVLPVHYNQNLVGVLEVFSHQKISNFGGLISGVKAALPLVAQLLQNSIEQFDQKIDNVIMQKFTPLQPTVQWKFNEVALDYLRSSQFGKKDVPIGKVTFNKVFPLFGSVDIRNSTNERNQALEKDISSILTLLNKEKKRICAVLPKVTALTVGQQFSGWYGRIDNFLRLSDSVTLNTFLESVVVPNLNRLMTEYPLAGKSIRRLKRLMEENSDEISGNRVRLEESIQAINSTLSSFFEMERKKLEMIYPCYFEIFRSDGVEYDIYTGQSIKPDLGFTNEHLKAFRLWQLRSMCNVIHLIDAIETFTPKQLSTTQLIYVNPHFIDISFRNDERHFDVDGAYNIRYQIVKKRIDKVLIKNTSERLTQPGTIAIVYFNEDDANEYLGYIQRCYEEGFLMKDHDILELEELQGVSGLKAIRVYVKH